MAAKIDLIVWVKINDLRDYDICSVCTAIVKFKANFFVDNNLSYLYQANVKYLFLA